MANKFIPDGDSAFAKMAERFSVVIAKDPARFFLTEEDARIIEEVTRNYRTALAQSLRRATKNIQTVARKDRARARAEAAIRKYGNLIRVNDAISPEAKHAVNVRERPGRLKRRQCPLDPPYLIFKRREDGVHVLHFRMFTGEHGKAKPPGAERLELFTEHVPPDQPIPTTPGKRPWYLRSFTTNTMKVVFPVPKEPVMVVYWGRWAGARGQVGRFSQTVTATVEGWHHVKAGDAKTADAPRLAA